MTAILSLLLSIAPLILLRPALAPPPPPPQVAPDVHAAQPLFETADRCMACHNQVSTSTGEDVSIGLDWRASMMANAARDPYWHAAVRREVLDHPAAQEAIEDKCSTCHMPMARYEAHLGGGVGQVFANLPIGAGEDRQSVLAADGVSCTSCHQITDEGLGDPSTFTGGFRVDESTPWGDRSMLGPFTTDEGRAALMRSATGFTPREARHIQSSELCASCHTLFTHALDDQGNEVGELAEQVPYLEWRHSAFPAEGTECQTCHMPVVSEPVPVTNVVGQPREEVNRHVFRGGNFFMLGMLNRYRADLGVEALPQEMDAAVRRTIDHLQSSAATLTFDSLAVIDGVLDAAVVVENLGGHKLPTAYPSRRVWIRFTVQDDVGRVLFESGAFQPDGAIAGNDNDEDGGRYEPHYDVVERPDQVQIYETIMVDWRDRLTTGLLYGVRYVKDNRILPRGFDKQTADEHVATFGAAQEDPDFRGGGDRIRYRVPVGASTGPLTVRAELWYQPIAYRWARNLEGYDAFETRRFTQYYDSMSAGSAIPLADVQARID